MKNLSFQNIFNEIGLFFIRWNVALAIVFAAVFLVKICIDNNYGYSLLLTLIPIASALKINNEFTTFTFFRISKNILGYIVSKGITITHVIHLTSIARLMAIPTFVAHWAWNKPKKLYVIIFCVGTMIAFMIHPVGSQAKLYTLYWVIPMICCLLREQSIIAHALTCSFIAHAAGSIVWLYTLTTTAIYWNALIPIVLTERINVTILLLVAHYLATLAINCYALSSAPQEINSPSKA